MSRPTLRLVVAHPEPETTTTTTTRHQEAGMRAMRNESRLLPAEEDGGMEAVFHLRMQTAAYECAFAVTARVLQPALVDFLS